MRIRRVLCVVISAASVFAASPAAFAQVDGATGTNVQEGDNRDTTRQGGGASSGDSVGGQVSGVVSSGRASVDARNTSRDSSVESGDAEGSNSASSFTGLSASEAGAPVANVQEGDNRSTLTQLAPASSGDAVGGQVIGSVVAPGGSSSIVADNVSDRVDVSTGDAESFNTAGSFVGLQAVATSTVTGDITVNQTNTIDCDGNAVCTGPQLNEATIFRLPVPGVTANTQEGDNRGTINQSAPATTGDGVAGQVIGSVSAGASSIDARNRSIDSAVSTGDADAANDADSFVGHIVDSEATFAGDVAIDQTNLIDCAGNAVCTGPQTNTAVVGVAGPRITANTQEGDNRGTINQSAPASTGDGVAGQVIGSVTAAGGSSSIVADNLSDRVDADTGDADSANTVESFVGQFAESDVAFLGDVTFTQTNVLDCQGNAECTGPQTNLALVGLPLAATTTNTQEGDNRATVNQSAPATTGDAVAGQVIGSVSAGASSIDARNRSVDSTAQSGDADSANAADSFVGTDVAAETIFIGDVSLTQTNVQDCQGNADCVGPQTNLAAVGILGPEVTANLQDGDNRGTINQSAPASTGDAVSGSVIGAVTAAGGSTSIVADNLSERVDAQSGDADSANVADSSVGPVATSSAVFVGDVDIAQSNLLDCEGNADCFGPQTNIADVGLPTASTVTNTQEGDNRGSLSQSAPASTGDAVTGQVIGAVSAGATSIDARNRSVDSTAESGDADSTNTADISAGPEAFSEVAFFGDVAVTQTNVMACNGNAVCTGPQTNEANVGAVGAELTANVQEGDNGVSLSQAAPATTGDAVAGQVIGAVTSAGGSASIVADNLSERVDAQTGDADTANDANAFVGMFAPSVVTATVGPVAITQAIEFRCAGNQVCSGPIANEFSDLAVGPGETTNAQEGDNGLSGAQTARASTGDAVAGQVIGAVSAGATSIDARNRSVDSVAETGDADATNDLAAFVGLNLAADEDDALDAADISGVIADHVHEGDNSSRLSQSADAVSGDAVAGQVTGVVTSAGGSASVVVDNLSEGIDAQSGESEFDNDQFVFVGLNLSSATAID